MKEKEYIARLFDKTLEFGLKSKGAVLFVGPKSCGKSTTAKRQAKTIIDLTDDDTKKQQIDLARASSTRYANVMDEKLRTYAKGLNKDLVKS